MRMPSNQERGGAGALIFWLVIIGVFVYLGTKFAPTYVASNQFVDSMDVQAKEAAAGNLSDEKVRKELIRRAKELELPIKDGNIHISRTGGEVIIEIQYTVKIDLPIDGGYQWKFSPRVARPILN